MENGISKTYLYLHRKDYVSTANEQERCAISSSMMRERRCPRTSPAIGIHFVRDGPGNGVTSALYTPHATKGKLPKISKVPYAWLFLAGFCLSFISFLFCVRNAPVYLRQPQDELHKIALDSAERRRNARRRQVSIAFDVPADGIDSNLFTLAVSGGASLAPLHSPLPRRNTTIYDDGEMNMSNREGDEANDTQMDQQSSSDSYEYYATDDDYHSNPNASEIRRDGKQCHSTSWQRLLFSTCNNLHEFDVQARFSRGDARYLT